MWFLASFAGERQARLCVSWQKSIGKRTWVKSYPGIHSTDFYSVLSMSSAHSGSGDCAMDDAPPYPGASLVASLGREERQTVGFLQPCVPQVNVLHGILVLFFFLTYQHILANISKIFQHNIKELSSYFIFFLYTKSLNMVYYFY